MTYLALALWAEGPSDGPFLRPVLRRLVMEHALRSARRVDIAEEFIALPDPTPDAGRDERISNAIAWRAAEISLLFIHSDGKGQPHRARDQAVQPAITRVSNLAAAPCCVAVVPKHETEAWMLADADALAYVLGVNTAKLAGFPALAEVERLSDPKQVLRAIQTAHQRRGRRIPLLDRGQLGEAVSFSCLRQLDAFRSCEDEVVSAMRDMRIL